MKTAFLLRIDSHLARLNFFEIVKENVNEKDNGDIYTANLEKFVQFV